jgi:hypothetical protein
MPNFESPDRNHEAVVVGAGAAGLGAAAELGRRGIGAIVLEGADQIGSSWARRYERLHLNTVRWLSAPRHSRIPRSAGRWPSRESFVEHLRDFARRESLAIEFGAEVTRIDRDQGGYALETSTGPRHAHYVVVATGYDRSPLVPPWPGLETFEGKLIHSAEYRGAGNFQDREVLVIGAGNTGTEIAVQLHRGGATRVWMSVRTPPNIVPLEPLGIPITLFARLSEIQPSAVVDRVGAALQRLALGDLSPYGLPSAPYGIGTELRVKGLGPVVDRGFVSALKAGDVELVPPVVGFDGDRVLLADGSHVEPQAAIAATGYRHGLERLVGHLGALHPSGRPTCIRGEANPEAPGLYFSGFWLPASGQLPAMRRTTRRIGREIARQRHADRSRPSLDAEAVE